MSYNNSFNLSIKKNEQKVAKVFCPNCDKQTESKFCQDCGKEGEIREVPIDNFVLISEFRKSPSCEEFYHLINENGDSEESCGGDGFENAIADFSVTYPLVVFQLDVQWESGLEDTPSRYYIQNGKIQDCKTQLIYEEFNESKLKK